MEAHWSGKWPRESVAGTEQHPFDEIPFDKVYEILNFNSPEEIYSLTFEAPTTGTCFDMSTNGGKTFTVWAFPFTWTMVVTDAVGQTCPASIPCKFKYSVHSYQGEVVGTSSD